MYPMPSPIFSLAVGYVLATAIAVGIGGYCLGRQHGNVARSFGVCMAAVALWAAGALGRLLASTPSTWYAATVVMFLGVVGTTVALFVFASLYTGWIAVTRRRVVALSIVPASTVFALLTNPEHGWFFAAVEPTTLGGRTVFTTVPGAWFWVHALYSYALLIATVVLLVGFTFQTHNLYRRQALSVVSGVVFALAVNVIYLLELWPTLPVDPTPIGFAVGSATVAYGLFGAKLVDVTPVARSAVVDAIDDAVFVLDDERRIVDRNPAAAAVLTALGVDDAAVGKHVEAVLPESLLDTESAHPIDVDGRRRWYRSRWLPLEPDGAVVLLTDVTEQVESTQQLEAQTRRLEELAGVAAHDLRNPLTAVSGYTRLARETGDLSYLDEVQPATERMELLADDLLTLSRQSRVVETSKPVSLRGIARRAWRAVGGTRAEATLTVETEKRVLADEERLRRLFESLFENCLEHGHGDESEPDGKRETNRIHVHVGTRPGGFYVEDDGSGIPVEERGRALEYGYSTRDGTGLGLPIVRSIAAAHRWDVELLESSTGGVRVEFVGVAWADDE